MKATPVGRHESARKDGRGRRYTVEMELSLLEGGSIVPTSITIGCPTGVDATMWRSLAVQELADEARRAMAKIWATRLERDDLDKEGADLAEDVKRATEK